MIDECVVMKYGNGYFHSVFPTEYIGYRLVSHHSKEISINVKEAIDFDLNLR